MAIGSATNVTEDGVRIWEKSVKDSNNIDEIFRNARDIGYTRLNQYRTTVVGKLSARFDSSDIYKVNVQSNAKLSLSLRLATDENEEAISNAEGDDKKLLNITAPGMSVQVYTMRGSREVLVADSSATEGTKLRTNMDNMLKGEYKATSGTYYVKISREKGVSENTEMPYALQLQQGDKPKHDYVVSEQVSDDTTNKKVSRNATSTYTSSDGTAITGANALQILATKNEGAANMLADGYLNVANIYNKNSKL